MKNVWRCILCLVGLVASVSASAQTYDGLDHLNRIIRGTPGITTAAINGGVTATATGAVNFATETGLRIPVPTTVTASISGAAIARGAARVAMRTIPWVAAAAVIAEVASAVKDSGIVVCPPPAFFCKQAEPTYWYRSTGGTFRDGYSACAAQHTPIYWRPESPTTCYEDKDFKYTYTTLVRVRECADGRPPSVGTSCDSQGGNAQPGLTSASESDLVNGIGAKGQTVPSIYKNLYDQMSAQNAGSTSTATATSPIMDDIKAAPISVSGSPVVGPKEQVKTSTYPNPDGSTSTEKVEKQVTIQPTAPPGATVSAPNVNYTTSTTTTTTIINNTTNVTNIKNETTAGKGAPAGEKLEIPTDYNREETQKKILDELQKTTDVKVPTGDEQIDAIKGKNQEGMAAVTAVSEGSTGLKAWLPTIKTATCRNPSVPNPVGGGMVDVPICNSVDVFSSIISGVIAVFALYGCVREVQAAIKA